MGGPNVCHYQEQHQQQYWHWRNFREEECMWKKQVMFNKEEYKETSDVPQGRRQRNYLPTQQKAILSLCMKWKAMKQ